MAWYIKGVNRGKIDKIDINIRDVDKSVFIIEDGGELFRLKNGLYINVCWRGSRCRVWIEDGKNSINYYNSKLGCGKEG